MFTYLATGKHRASSFLFLLAVLFECAGLVRADCECGYSTSVNDTTYVFTDLIESDFLHLSDIRANTDWARQEFNVSAAASRGTYGTSFRTENVVSNPLANASAWSGAGKLSGDPGIQLYVKGGIPADGLVSTSELDSTRSDIRYGSMRTAMKLSDVSGTCGAFFWYYNDSQEIDIEFLTQQFNKENQTFPVNILMQSATSAQQGFQSVGANYQIVNLPFDPTDGFHEYRIDFHPDFVIFYADGTVLAQLATSPSLVSSGHLILRHWSNGNPGWSAGPPATDSALTVSYVKAYFNSSDTTRQSNFASRCKSPATTNAVCKVPDQNVAPNGDNADTFFFSNQQNSTEGQTVYKSTARHISYVSSLILAISLGLMSTIFVLGLVS